MDIKNLYNINLAEFESILYGHDYALERKGDMQGIDFGLYSYVNEFTRLMVYINSVTKLISNFEIYDKGIVSNTNVDFYINRVQKEIIDDINIIERDKIIETLLDE